MSPRPYRLGQRQAATEQTRSRILAATREILTDDSGVPGFTIEAVSRRAGVARMTVYYQFRSKRGLLEALFDDLANRGLMPHLRPVLHQADPRLALDGLIGAFSAFWASDRLVMRRVRCLAALDPEIGESVSARDERRREHLRGILQRLHDQDGRPTASALPAAVDVLHVLTSFETFDALVRDGRDIAAATAIIRALTGQTINQER